MEGVVRSLALFCMPVLAVSVMAGCARFKTTQVDERKNPNGESTTISTHVSASTLWTSRSQLANFKASQTEKSQGASVGSLSQESSGTNTVRVIEALRDIIVKLP
jgi:predicted negative regulator of RcsB-dependent stress response